MEIGGDLHQTQIPLRAPQRFQKIAPHPSHQAGMGEAVFREVQGRQHLIRLADIGIDGLILQYALVGDHGASHYRSISFRRLRMNSVTRSSQRAKNDMTGLASRAKTTKTSQASFPMGGRVKYCLKKR